MILLISPSFVVAKLHCPQFHLVQVRTFSSYTLDIRYSNFTVSSSSLSNTVLSPLLPSLTCTVSSSTLSKKLHCLLFHLVQIQLSFLSSYLIERCHLFYLVQNSTVSSSTLSKTALSPLPPCQTVLSPLSPRPKTVLSPVLPCSKFHLLFMLVQNCTVYSAIFTTIALSPLPNWF
jgi:hypothetical protein